MGIHTELYIQKGPHMDLMLCTQQLDIFSSLSLNLDYVCKVHGMKEGHI
jgi:hypothetical protein